MFPGGELNSPSDLDYLRNLIFSLANPRSLDGLISWSSVIGNAISPEEFRAFLAYDEALVTESSGWAEGEAACARLIEDRGLLPHRDFDTLIGSSDMMALPAIQYLSKLGYSTWSCPAK
ncbi:hypothetical protein FACS189462_5250 [Spirochaetia bacterium]|nr:hypothetical protein FACS189462_5250 [Spirochaetia bacterium]